MTLGVLLSIGESFGGLRASGQESRFVREYLDRYARSFDRVYVFSYARESVRLPQGVVLVPNHFRLHRFLYVLLLPLIEARAVRSCDVLRVMQAPGAIPAFLAHLIYRIPYVVTYGYEYVRLAAFERKRVRAFLLRLLLSPLLKAARAVIVTTPLRRAELERRGVRSVALIPNGVDLTVFKPPVRSARRERIRILYVGRLEPEKNLPLLMEALDDEVLRERVELVCIGRGSEQPRLERLAREQRVPVRFLGTISHRELSAHYRDADIFALLSVSEGHPKALLEALASGLVCLVSPVVGQVVGLTHDVNALFVQPSATEVRKEFTRLLEDPGLRARLGKEARAFALANLDIRKTMDTEIRLLQQYAQ